jgi:hemoglobin
MTTAAPASLYERLGGVAAISAAVDDFYRRVTADPRLAPYFTNTDMAALRRHQVAMLAAATGGPNEYRGRIMAEAHAGRSITDEHFDAVVGHLVETLQSLGVDDHTIGEVGSALLPLRADIVTA